jgi:hypothetical protein
MQVVVNVLPRIRPVFKYVYLMTFFALLAGFFHPIIRQSSFDGNLLGIFVLFLGTAGGVLLYKSTESQQPSWLMGVGFGLIGISLYFILLIAGRL